MRIKPSHALACIATLGAGLMACTGNVGHLGGSSPPGGGSTGTGNTGTGAGGDNGGTGAGPGGGGNTGQGGDGGGGFTTPLSTYAAVRKIKSVLTGLAPTDAEVAAATDATALKGLIDTWTATPQFQDKMILFFQNAYQQSSLAVLDYEFQLRKRPGAFDLPYAIFGDNAFPMLFKNLKESFARTALELIAEGRPFTDILTTQRFMMTTALKSMYMQIEMPYDIHTFNFQFNHGTRPALTDTLDPTSANYLVFGYVAPTTTTGKGPSGTTCAGDATKVSTYPGSTNLFHVLLGVIDRDSTNNGQGSTNLGCFEHAIQPYFTAQDLSDWQMVTITSTGTPIVSYNLPALRAATTLPSRLPRVSFFTTPSFLAVWNTNDSNQHRVTANQALLAALGEGFTNATAAIPNAAELGRARRPARRHWHGLLRLPQEPRSDAPVLAEPVRLQRPGAGQSDIDSGELRVRRRHAERHQPGRLRHVPGPGHRCAGRGPAGQPVRARDHAAPVLLRQFRDV